MKAPTSFTRIRTLRTGILSLALTAVTMAVAAVATGPSAHAQDPDGVTPAAPRDLRLVEQLAAAPGVLQYASISWSGPGPYYHVQSRRAQDPDRTLGLLTNGTRLLVCSDVAECAPHEQVRVRTCIAFEFSSTNRCSGWTSWLELRPAAPPPARAPMVEPLGPRTLYIIRSRSPRAIITWEDRATNETHYEVTYGELRGTTETFTIPADSTSADLMVYRDTIYEVWVKACNGERCSGPASLRFITQR